MILHIIEDSDIGYKELVYSLGVLLHFSIGDKYPCISTLNNYNVYYFIDQYGTQL